MYMALCSGHIERIHRYVTGGYPRVNTRPEASPFEELRFFDLKRVVHSRLGLSRGIVAGALYARGITGRVITGRVMTKCRNKRG